MPTYTQLYFSERENNWLNGFKITEQLTKGRMRKQTTAFHLFFFFFFLYGTKKKPHHKLLKPMETLGISVITVWYYVFKCRQNEQIDLISVWARAYTWMCICSMRYWFLLHSTSACMVGLCVSSIETGISFSMAVFMFAFKM